MTLLVLGLALGVFGDADSDSEKIGLSFSSLNVPSSVILSQLSVTSSVIFLYLLLESGPFADPHTVLTMIAARRINRIPQASPTTNPTGWSSSSHVEVVTGQPLENCLSKDDEFGFFFNFHVFLVSLLDCLLRYTNGLVRE